MNKFAFVDCTTVDEALGQLGDGATVKAGGIDLLDLMKDDIVSPSKLVNIRNVESLRGITSGKDGLHLGPLSTLSEIADHPEIQKSYTALADAAGHAATPQVRNMATLGGNIMQRPRCWYFRSSDFDCKKKSGSSDDCHAHTGENQYHAIMNNGTCAMVHPSSTAVPLLAMNAQVELTSKRGKRTVAMSDFYVPPEKEPPQRDRSTTWRTDYRHLRTGAGARHSLCLSEIWRKGELRLAPRGCRSRISHGRNPLPKGIDRARCRRPDAHPFHRSRGHPDRKNNR